MTELLILAGGGVSTWALRASFITLLGERTLPPMLLQLFASARHAVLGALLVTAVVGPTDVEGLFVPSPRLLAAGAAILVAWYTGGALRTLAAGMLAAAVFGYLWP